MIDTHLHILPGVDDGPETMEEAIALARVLVQEGISTAIATPHYNDLYPQRSVLEIKERVNELQLALDRQRVPLRLFSGHEALIKPRLVEDIQAGKLATLNGSRYLLLELWNNAWIPETERVIFELRAFGMIPIIAHPERYRAIQQNTDLLLRLLEQGVLAQLTASSLLGMQGNSARKCAEALLKKGYIHCIASDAHSLKRRPPGVARGLQRATELLGQAALTRLIETYPTAIIANEPFNCASSSSNNSSGK
jgi:protein-tyrosine phosphatase